MLRKVKSIGVFGIDTLGIDIEINISSRGMPGFEIVGLPNKAVAESKQRVKSAIQNSGFKFPNKKITVNLAPADLNKSGSYFDLGIALGILGAENNINLPQDALFYGELSLDGSTRSSKGVFAAGLYASSNKIENIFVPEISINELSIIKNVNIYPIRNLNELYNHLSGDEVLSPYKTAKEYSSVPTDMNFNFDDIIGQEKAKRVISIMVAGGHHTLLYGPPGIGKTMLARALPSILPKLTPDDSINVTRIYSSIGVLDNKNPLFTYPPIRNPHHSISSVGLLGGSLPPRPGEITLSHKGYLFLDELCEFPRIIIDALRQPLEEGVITISRGGYTHVFPAKFTLLAATNPCKCGFYGDLDIPCKCSQSTLKSYRSKLTGPVLDRIDLICRLNRESSRMLDLYKNRHQISNKLMKQWIITAKEIQSYREEKSIRSIPDSYSNGISVLIDSAIKTYNLSTRAVACVFRVARTIADMRHSESIIEDDILESLQYKVEGIF